MKMLITWSYDQMHYKEAFRSGVSLIADVTASIAKPEWDKLLI